MIPGGSLQPALGCPPASPAFPFPGPPMPGAIVRAWLLSLCPALCAVRDARAGAAAPALRADWDFSSCRERWFTTRVDHFSWVRTTHRWRAPAWHPRARLPRPSACPGFWG